MVIRFTSLLWIWKGCEQAGRWYFVTVPEDLSAGIKAHAFGNPRGFGSVRVEVTVKEITWQTSVFPLNSGGYVLPIKADVRKQAGLSVGDELACELRLR